MEITDLIGYSLSSPYGDGSVFGQPLGVKSIGLVEVHTDAGYIGIGETYSGVYSPELISPIAEFLKSIVIGQDPFAVEDINKSLEIPFISGNGLIRSFISAIDIALWDIMGQTLNKPISKLINEKVRNTVKVYASGGSVVMTTDEICADVEKVINQGYVAYKMRVGAQPWGKDLERVSRARKMLGADNELMIDAIMGTLPNSWDLQTAKSRAKDLISFRPCWLEEPLPPEDYLGYQKLNAETELSIAMGESFTGLHEFKAYISGKCANIIQPDVTHCGGFSQAIKIIAFAKKYDIPVALHVWGSAISIMSNLHLAMAMPEVRWLEIPQVKLELFGDEISEHLTIEKGFVSKLEKPGLGLNICEAKKNKYPFVPGSGYQVSSIKK